MLVCIMMSSAMQYHSGSKPNDLMIGIDSGTKINMIEIRSRTKPATKVTSRITVNVPQAPSCDCSRRFCNAIKPPAAANTPANINPPTTIVSTIAVIDSVVRMDSFITE